MAAPMLAGGRDRGAGRHLLEPIRSNFDFGQINVVLMTLVIADCVPRKTPWPRGMLLGSRIALKLTPAVFLLYFLLRRTRRALLVDRGRRRWWPPWPGFAFAWRDPWRVLDLHRTQHRPHRHRDAEHQPEHRGSAGPARPRRGRAIRAVDAGLLRGLGLTVWAVRRVCAAEPAGAGADLCGVVRLVVSPVSWSHHWVWALPTCW
jgi:alpha-1,2-mannosyltransferase